MLLSILVKKEFLSQSTVNFLNKNHIRTTEGLKQHYKLYRTFMNLSESSKKLELYLIDLIPKLDQIEQILYFEIPYAKRHYLIKE